MPFRLVPGQHQRLARLQRGDPSVVMPGSNRERRCQKVRWGRIKDQKEDRRIGQEAGEEKKSTEDRRARRRRSSQ